MSAEAERAERVRRYYVGRHTPNVVRRVRRRLQEADAIDALHALDRLSCVEVEVLVKQELGT